MDRSIQPVSNIAFEQGIAKFSFALYSAIPKSGNEFISPYSVSAALLLLMLGTDGTTKNEIISSIFSGEIPKDVHLGYKILDEKLAKRTETGVTLSVANRLFGSLTFSVLHTYMTDALKYYGSELELLDFVTQTEQSRVRINNWVSTKTNDKIKDMIPQGVLNANTVMVLTNAIYFKGTWKKQFDPKETRKVDFQVGPNITRKVDMMYGNYNATTGQNTELNCKALQLPYSGNKLSMVFILPNDDNGLSQLESQLTMTKFQTLLSGLRTQKSHLELPKFVIKSEYDLKPILMRLGISEIFDNSAANFIKMVSPQLNGQSVSVSDARHKAFVEVNEEGSEAAAATTITIGITAVAPPPFQFVADHPFMFVILDNETGTPLFIGRYAEP